MPNCKNSMGNDKEETGSGMAHVAGMNCSCKHYLCGDSCGESVTPILFT